MTHEYTIKDCRRGISDGAYGADEKPATIADEYNTLRRETNKLLEQVKDECSREQELTYLSTENKVLRAHIDSLCDRLAKKTYQVDKCHRTIESLNAQLKDAKTDYDELRIRKDNCIHVLERIIEGYDTETLWQFLCRWW